MTGARSFVGLNLLHQATVTLTDAQIKALPTSPVTIIPALGVNRRPLLMMGSAMIDARGGGYVVAVGAHMALFQRMTGLPINFSTLIGHSGGPIEEVLADDNDITINDFLPILGADGGLVVSSMTWWYPVDLTNQPVHLWLKNTPNLTGGHPSNTLTVSVLYSVFDIETKQFV